MKYRIVFILALLLLLFRTEYSISSDFVILPSGDTIFGKVKDRNTSGFRDRVYKRIRFKGEDGRKRFLPRQIKGYAVDGRIYESFPFHIQGVLADKIVFARNKRHSQFIQRVYQDDKLTYYLYELTNDEDRSVLHVPYFHLHHKNWMARATQGILGFKKKLMMDYFSEYAELVRLIDQNQVKTVEGILDYFKSI